MFPFKFNKNESSFINCDESDIYNNYFISDNKFKCRVTGTVNNVRGSLSCNSPNFVYIISCTNCGDQYVVSTTDFKATLRIQKSDIKTKKERCGTARYFNRKCCDSYNCHIFLQVALLESVQSDIHQEGKLWERKKYWQCQLCTNIHGINSVSDLYYSKRKICMKN